MNAFVTGGSRGIGRAIVIKLAQEGLGCAFTYARSEAAAEETLKLAEAAAGDSDSPIRAYRMDLKDSAAVESVVERAIEELETIEVVVNNAGVVRNNAAVLMGDDEWDEVIATNLSGPFYVIRSFLMHMIANRSGRIINISSLAQDGASGQVNYAASKGGLVALTKSLAREYGPKGITANIVTVGLVETGMTEEHLAEQLREAWLKYCPIKRIGNAEEIAGLVHYLTTATAAFINGEVVRVSGGLTYVP